jgi:methionyl-tRNA formyltransferase
MPPLGTYNLHGSLLPKYRGAAPINWAIINGDMETGVTSFKLKHEIDTGDVLIQQPIPIEPMDTAGDLHDKMMHVAAKVILTSVNKIAANDLEFFPQDDTKVSKAPKIFHDTCKIDFNQSTQTVFNFVRGLSPYPAAWTNLDEMQLDIYRTHALICEHKYPPGTILTDQKKKLRISTLDGFLEVKELKLQGKRRMDVNSFLNGYTITDCVIIQNPSVSNS